MDKYCLDCTRYHYYDKIIHKIYNREYTAINNMLKRSTNEEEKEAIKEAHKVVMETIKMDWEKAKLG
jgi:hypothetical protein